MSFAEPDGSVMTPPGTPPQRVDRTLLAAVQQDGRFDPSCLNCGGCSSVCDMTGGDVTFPRKPIRRVVLGLKDAVLAGLEPWLCLDCGDCTIACPRQVDPAESMRTLRRYLTGQYDVTGLASLVLRSRAWHAAVLLAVSVLVLALAVLYHVRWVGLGPSDLGTPMGLTHMFPKILWFTWIVYAIPALFLVVHVARMYRFAMRRERPELRHFAAALWTFVVEIVTQERMRKCPSEARAAPGHARWLPEEHPEAAGPGTEVIHHRWLKHWLMAFGCVIFFVLTAFFLRWFQTDEVHPLYHPQRWIGYLAAAFILWGTSDVLLRRFRHRNDPRSRHRGAMMPALLWLTAVTGLLVHACRLLGLDLVAHYAYAAHLAVCVPLVVVEVPFGDWAHMIDRPIAIYFQAVRDHAKAAAAAPAAGEETGLSPARA